MNQNPQIALRIEHGDPSAEELAALVAVLAAASTATEPASRPARSGWVERARQPRRVPSPGVGAWRRSALPG